MKRYQLRATLLSPVVVKRDRQSQRSEGTPSLSGSIVRGALATLYLQEHGQADERFRRLFLDETVCRFGPLDPEANTLPITAVSCKRHPGFRTDGQHGMADHLWSRIASRLAGQVLRGGKTIPEECLECPNDLKPQHGFWRDQAGKAHQPDEIGRRLSMHVGIDRATHTAADTILYSLDAIDPLEEETELVGWLDADESALADLQGLLKQSRGQIRVGHARTRGYGKVRLDVEEKLQAEQAGWDAWNNELLGFLGDVRKEFHPPRLLDFQPQQHFFFSLSLPAGAVLVDSLLRSSIDPANMLPDWPSLPPPEPGLCVLGRTATKLPGGGKLWCVAAVAHPERSRGWNAAHGLPRQDEWTVTRGAVYAYLLEGDGSARSALVERLARLEREGIGARRNEGFGRVIVSDDFHRRFHTQEPPEQP